MDILIMLNTPPWISSGHTGIPGLWMLDSRRWTMDHGHYTLNTGLWTRDTANVCFRTESEHSF